jgi:hypothetical protein
LTNCNATDFFHRLAELVRKFLKRASYFFEKRPESNFLLSSAGF